VHVDSVFRHADSVSWNIFSAAPRNLASEDQKNRLRIIMGRSK
jgi:hypothetical protein